MLPLAVSSQGVESQADLHATIKAAIQADPRATDMTAAQIDAMTDALVVEAQAQGVTAHDILWRPVVPAPPAAAAGASYLNAVPFLNVCGNESSILCRLNNALGLDGTNLLIPLVLGIASALLLLVLVMLVMHHKHTGVHLNAPPPLF